MSRVYLDWNATAPLRVEARDAMIAAMDAVGNPSSVHGEGRAAKAIIETAREHIAALMGCDRGDLIFTGSATEAAAMSFPEMQQPIGSLLDHDAVYSHLGFEGADPRFTWDVDQAGHYTHAISGPEVTGGDVLNTMWDDIVCLQSANSETGVVQNTLSLSQEVWKTERKALVLVDGVQAFGKIPFGVDRTGGDFVLASPHKFGGPKGVGVLYVKPNVETRRLYGGGGQEEGRRAGTENVIGFAGAGAAAKAAKRDLDNGVWEPVAVLRNQLEARLVDVAPDVILFGKQVDRLPNTSCFAVPGWKGETQVMQMDLAGFAISAGSACSSGKVKASRVLKAMGYDDITASSSIRVSIGPTTTEKEVMRFADAWIKAYHKFTAKAA